MADIGKQRLIHELPQQFALTQEHIDALIRQMDEADRESMARFSHGFQAEDWYCALFAEMPWTILIHGLDQHQCPERSKATYQVPDFLALIETTSLKHIPLLLEVKRVASNKQSLSIRGFQASHTQLYADKLGITLLYATYWDVFGVWTINTPDSFESKSSRRRLPLLKAMELDCSGIFGDVSYLVFPPMRRTMTFSSDSGEYGVVHEDYGGLVSDRVETESRALSLNTMQSAALDAVFQMKRVNVSTTGAMTTISESLEEICSIKLSWWIARHLAKFQTRPESSYVNMSAHIIAELAEQLDIKYMTMFPQDATPQISSVQSLCFS